MRQPTLPTFNTLLSESGINPTEVLLMRHRPSEASLNLIFDSIATEHSTLFNCYQSTQPPRTEAALKRATYLASFIRGEPAQAIFIGLFKVEGYELRSAQEIAERPLHKELVRLGMSIDPNPSRENQIAEFSLKDTEWGENLKERLVIYWPGNDRSWYQWGARGLFATAAIALKKLERTPAPAWNELCLTLAELNVMPRATQDALRQWRGVYLIADIQDRRQYVGSAASSENILQRWQEYATSGHGGNKHLRGRDPQNFRFSILERVSPDAQHKDVIRLEANWKRCLLSRWPYGLNEN